MVKKIISLIITVISITTCPTILDKKVEVINISSESQNGIYLKEGEKVVELSDGSFAIYGNNKYVFYVRNLGDWSYKVNSLEELEKIVLTYIELSNNN